jgi:hypothetical protein
LTERKLLILRGARNARNAVVGDVQVTREMVEISGGIMREENLEAQETTISDSTNIAINHGNVNQQLLGSAISKLQSTVFTPGLSDRCPIRCQVINWQPKILEG